MSHDAREVANYLIEKSVSKGRPLTPVQIIKMGITPLPSPM